MQRKVNPVCRDLSRIFVLSFENNDSKRLMCKTNYENNRPWPKFAPAHRQSKNDGKKTDIYAHMTFQRDLSKSLEIHAEITAHVGLGL